MHAPNEGVLISPDGRLGVLSRGGNLWLRVMQTGEERALTKDGEGPNYGYGIYPGGWKAASIARERAVASGYELPPMETSWSPDSRTILVPRVDQRHVADYPYLETVPADGSFRPKPHLVRVPLVGERPPTFEWYAVDAATGQSRRLDLPYDSLLVLQQDLLAVRKTWWSTDSRHLFAVAFGYNMEWAYLFDVDVGSGAVRTVIEEHMLPRMDLNSTSYNPPNVRITRDGTEVIWFSQRDGWGHLYLYDGRTGRLENQITKGNWLVRDIIDVDERRRQIFFTAGGRDGSNPYDRYLYRVRFDGSDLTLLSPERADHILTSPYNDVLSVDGAKGYQVVSPSGKYVVYTYSTPQTPPQTVIRSVADGHSHRNGGEGRRQWTVRDGLPAARRLCREGGGRHDGHLGRHVQAEHLRLDEALSGRRPRVRKPAHRRGPARLCESHKRRTRTVPVVGRVSRAGFYCRSD